MKVFNLDESRGALQPPAQPFTTGDARIAALARDLGLGGAAVTSVVAFEPGARTLWHTHDGGQILVVLSGTCEAAGETGDPIVAAPGSVLFAAPHERHWHGAAARDRMVHLSVTLGRTDWHEAVDAASATEPREASR